MHVQPFICCNTENIWILYISIYQHMKYDTFYLMWQEMWLRGAFDKFDRIIKNYILQSICKWVFPQYVTVTSWHADTRFSSVFSSGLNGALVQETGSYLQKLWKPYHDWQSLVVFFYMSEKNRKIWINSSSGFVCLSSRVIWSLWNHLMLPEMHIPKPTLSNMSLTCQGRPEELYLLQHEVQPLNSCWQSCSSANHPLTYNTGISNI